MKRIFYFINTLMLIFLTNSCSEREGTLFDFGGKDFAAFETENYTFEANEEGKNTIYLYHLSDGVSRTFPIIVDYLGEEELFTVSQDYITFDENSNKAAIEINYNLEDLEYYVPYTLEVSIPEQTAYPLKESLVYSVSIEITRPVTFSNLGTGIFISEVLEGAEEWEQQFLLADQIPLYRLPDLYESGYPVNVMDNGDGTVTVKAQPAWYDEDNVDIYVEGNGVIEGNVITLALEHFVWDGDIKYSLGVFKEILILPEK